MEAVPLSLSPERLRHVLRHFSTVSQRVGDHLRATGASDEVLAGAVAAAGSRFAPALGDALDVVALLSTLGPRGETPQADGSRALTWVLDRSQFPDGAGTCGVVPLDSLSDEERSKIVTEDRVGSSVQVIARDTPLATWTITAIVEPAQGPGALPVRTLFPGPYAPPFPGSLQPGHWRDEAEAFWAGHVLVRGMKLSSLPPAPRT